MGPKARLLIRAVIIVIAISLTLKLYFRVSFDTAHHLKRMFTVLSPGNKTNVSASSWISVHLQKFKKLTVQNTQVVRERNNSNESGKEKVILFYTTWFGDATWSVEGINTKTLMFEHAETGKPCEHKCRLTFDKNELSSSDAVMFHSTDIPGNIRELSGNRTNDNQRWIYYTHENPYNAGRDPASMNGIFNWTMTYRKDSEIWYPYNEFQPLQKRAKVKRTINYAKGKTNLITWSVGHCEAQSLRDNIVQKLTNYLPIIINGDCAALFPKRKQVATCGRTHEAPACTRLYQTTKFYLALENGLCPDYVSEKYWNVPLGSGMVPIVYGPQDYYNRIAIPGSYINLYDFPSIEVLANYIKYLDKNDTAYNEYFTWKTKYRVTIPLFPCRFCDSLHNKSLPIKVYNDLGSYYSKEVCDKNLEKVKEYL